jgi:hypothetical protein
MSKLGLLLATMIAFGAAHDASAFELKGTPYTFAGSVISATAACPYKAKAKLAGYTLLDKRYNYLPPKYQPIAAGFSGPALIFSPGGTAEKSTMKIGNLPLRSGAVSGSSQVILLPDLTVIKGTYKGTFSVKTGGGFTLNYTSIFKNKSAICTTTYDLTFAVGVPAHLLNLL